MSQLAQQVAVPGVALAVLPFNVHVGDRRFGFEHRIHRWQNGEHQGLKEDDGLNAEPAKIPRLSRRDTLHSYAARVFRMPPKGTPDQVQASCVRWRNESSWRPLRTGQLPWIAERVAS